MIIGFGSLAASTPYLGLILLAIVGMWIFAAKVRGSSSWGQTGAAGWVGCGEATQALAALFVA